MFEYEQQIRSAELIRDAENYRRAREARRAAAAAAHDHRALPRSASGTDEQDPEGEVQRRRIRRFRLPRAA